MAQSFSFVRTGAFSPTNLEALVTEATPLARSLTSKTPRIAMGLGSSGRIFIGFDVELPGLPLNFSIHAEQFLVANLVLNNEPKLDMLAISNDGRYCAPCGNCCQFLQELHNANEIQTLIPGPTTLGFMPLGLMLPQPYNAFFPRSVPDLIQKVNLQLRLIDTSTKPSRFSSIKSAALDAAKRSYGPYTNAPSGVALMDGMGNLYRGSYLESVASFPSLGPLQAALVHFVISTGGREFQNIKQAVLVEKPNLRFSQKETAAMILKNVAHFACSFKIFPISDCRSVLLKQN